MFKIWNSPSFCLNRSRLNSESWYGWWCNFVDRSMDSQACCCSIKERGQQISSSHPHRVYLSTSTGMAKLKFRRNFVLDYLALPALSTLVFSLLCPTDNDEWIVLIVDCEVYLLSRQIIGRQVCLFVLFVFLFWETSVSRGVSQVDRLTRPWVPGTSPWWKYYYWRYCCPCSNSKKIGSVNASWFESVWFSFVHFSYLPYCVCCCTTNTQVVLLRDYIGRYSIVWQRRPLLHLDHRGFEEEDFSVVLVDCVVCNWGVFFLSFDRVSRCDYSRIRSRRPLLPIARWRFEEGVYCKFRDVCAGVFLSC